MGPVAERSLFQRTLFVKGRLLACPARRELHFPPSSPAGWDNRYSPHVRAWRLTIARATLSSGDETVVSIARKVGYTSQSALASQRRKFSAEPSGIGVYCLFAKVRLTRPAFATEPRYTARASKKQERRNFSSQSRDQEAQPSFARQADTETGRHQRNQSNGDHPGVNDIAGEVMLLNFSANNEEYRRHQHSDARHGRDAGNSRNAKDG